MKTLIVGYSDRSALSAAQIICGLESSVDEQAEILDQAQRLHKFPDGVLRLEQYLIDEPIQTAIFISEETAKSCQDREAARRKAEKAEAEKRAARQKAEADIITANKAFTAAAEKRNKAIAAVAAQKSILANLPGDEKALKKITELQPAADRAIAEFQTVLELRNLIKNPKSAPEDIAAAVKLLADPAKALDQKLKVEADTKAAAEKAAAEASAGAAS